MASVNSKQHPEDERTIVLRELRRSRKYLRALLEDLSEIELEAFPTRGRIAGGACAKWHAGHVAFLERQILSGLVPPLHAALSEAELRFAPHGMADRSETFPLQLEIDRQLNGTRRLTEALVDNLALGEPELDIFREIVNAEYAQARFIRQRRSEAGKPDVADPSGVLLRTDTDCELAPRFHLAAWAPPPKRRPAGEAEIVSLEDRRHLRAVEAMERGHRLVTAGDPRAALQCFVDAASLETSADALTYQGWMHAMLGDPERAERLCLSAIELDPDFGNPYNDIGTICLQRRDVPAAIEWFERAKRARRYEPRHFPFMNLGRLYSTLGMPEKALAEFEGALAHAPANADIRSAIESLRSELKGGIGTH